MRTVSYRLVDLDKVRINLGFQGENEHTQILFDCKKAFEEYPGAVQSLAVVSPHGEKYPAVTTREGNYVSWLVSDVDTAYHGDGMLQLSFIQGEVVKKTYRARTHIHESINADGNPPSGVENWIETANQTLAEIPQSIQDALTEAQQSGVFDGVGIVSIAKTGTSGLVDTYTVTLTNEDTYEFTVTNGKDGENGAPGADGQDGTPGRDGTDGQDGTSAYVWIKYAAVQPTVDADMKSSPDAWIGIYSGDADNAPAHYTDYTWYKIKGEPGAVQDVQVNGTSVLVSGIANIPTAGQNIYGVVQKGDSLVIEEAVNGSTPSITGVANHLYVCGECSTLSIVVPESGIIDVLFKSGTTATVLTVTSAKSGVTSIKWADGFDPTNLEASTTYELNIMDGEYGVIASWT